MSDEVEMRPDRQIMPLYIHRILGKARILMIHLRRELEGEMYPSKQVALGAVHSKVLDDMELLNSIKYIPNMAHVCDHMYESLVVPLGLYEEFKLTLTTAGFKPAPDERQFACADGLQEALVRGGKVGRTL